jgi:adenine-specific DNA methylase
MIYAQRPEATSCAEYDLWNDKMGRYIRRGSKGIALVDDSGDTPRLRYVFDIADTGTRPHSRHPYLWSMDQEHTAPVQAMLERRYDISGDSLPQQLADVAGKLADEFWTDNGADILRIVDGSFLEEYDNLNVAVQFKSATTISITYALMSHCGLEPERYFDHEDFMAIFDFNTPATVAALGTAVSKSCQEVLRQIGITIQNVEREAIEERRNRDEQQLNLQNERGLSDTRPRTEPDRQPAVGQVRENEKIVPETASPGDLQPDASLGNSVSAPRGDRADGEQPHRADDAGTDAGGRRDREPESHRPDDVGRADEQLQGTGGGNRPEGAYSQLSFFPTETEQIYRIDEAESVQQTPFAFSFAKPQEETPQPVREVTQADIDAALQVWNGDIKSKQRTERYMLDHARDKDTAAWLKAEFGGELPVFSVSLSGTDQTATLPWAKVQRHLAKLVKEDRFFTEEEQNNFDNIDTDYVREQLESGEESPFVRQVMEDAERIEQEAELPASENFRITDDHLGEGGAKAKFRANMDAIATLKKIESDNVKLAADMFKPRTATMEEQAGLSRYVGWGGLSDAFDAGKPAWAEEYKELLAALSPSEYEAARASTLNAHYTSPAVIRAIYEAVGIMGFTTGNILEPSCGVGNFFGMLPESMSNSRLYGVELDSITGRIAQQLYPKANITVAGFETTDRRDFFDLAVGNVPFGQYKVNDPAYNRLGFNIHNYFFAKALDQVRPGGVVAFVTSRYTMDSKDNAVRKYLAQRAELLGAIRLPNNAFKANAGTEVVSDILFFQKRDRVIDIQPDWVHLGESDNGYAINSYFADHPEMILGTVSEESTQYGRQDFTVLSIEALQLPDQLHDAVKYIRGQYTQAELPDLDENEAADSSIPADTNVKNYSYTVVDGKVYYRENSIMVRPKLNATAEERVGAWWHSGIVCMS